MDLVELLINTFIAVVGIFIGRVWEKNDHRSKKDKEFIDEILLIVPVDGFTYELLMNHDFGDLYLRESIRPLFRLNVLLKQPTKFFFTQVTRKTKT